MKKLLSLFAIVGMFAFGTVSTVYAQETPTEQEEVSAEAPAGEEVEEAAQPEEVPAQEEVAKTAETKEEGTVEEEEADFHQVLKNKFIEGDPMFMVWVLICLIFGLAICIERIIYLSMATSNSKKLIADVEGALSSGGVDAAKEVCRNTRGPVASIFYQGLQRSDEGLDMVEKSVVAYGSVQMGLLEKGLSWVSLFIALAPMLGFMGTVIGMIGAFDDIAAANNISPGIVAGGIGVALITTVSGLVVAMILQFFYNFIVAKIDSIVNDMEDASISLIDLLIVNNKK